MNCPNCQSSLRTIEYEGVSIRTCDSCGGEFLGAAEIRHIVGTREQRFSAETLAAMAGRSPAFGVPDDQQQRSMTCPSCNAPMTARNYCGDTGVCVDRCEGCGGVWLDHQELEHVQALMERWEDDAPEQVRLIAGELEEARRAAAAQTNNAFAGSRFAFVNALINRVLDAA